MNTGRLLPAELLHAIDIGNTIDGGVSQSIVKMIQHDNSHEVKCKVPGVAGALLRVDVINNFLNIYYVQEFLSNENNIQIPKMIHHKAIPYFVDVARISAEVEDGFLCVTLPFNKLANGYRKRISVQK